MHLFFHLLRLILHVNFSPRHIEAGPKYADLNAQRGNCSFILGPRYEEYGLHSVNARHHRS